MLTHLFPLGNSPLLPILVALPLVSAFLILVFGRRLGDGAVHLLASFSSLAALLASLFGLLALPEGVGIAAYSLGPWFEVVGFGPGVANLRSMPVQWGLRLDALAGVSTLLLSFVVLLVVAFSALGAAGGAHEDSTCVSARRRLLGILAAFHSAMLVVILADNLPLLLVGLESSALLTAFLIGVRPFQEGRGQSVASLLGVYILSDLCFAIGMGLVAYYIGSLELGPIFQNRAALLIPIQVWPIAEGGALTSEPLFVNASTLVAFLLLAPAIARGGLLGFHALTTKVALAPTKARALLLAVGTVPLGIYLICRLAPLLVLSTTACLTLACLGCLSALVGALMSAASGDVRRILAGVAVTQVGFMCAGLGVGAFSATLQHLIASSLALTVLVLGISLIAGLHQVPKESRWELKSLRLSFSQRPWVSGLIVLPALSLAAVPLSGGGFSLSGVVMALGSSHLIGPAEVAARKAAGLVSVKNIVWESWMSAGLQGVVLVTLVVSAFALARLCLVPLRHAAHAADEAKSPQKGQALALSLTVGLAYLSALFGLGPLSERRPLSEFLRASLKSTEPAVALFEEPLLSPLTSASLCWAMALVGLGLAFANYRLAPAPLTVRVRQRAPGLVSALEQGLHLGKGSHIASKDALDSLAELAAGIERFLVQLIFMKLPAVLASVGGTLLRLAHTGRVQAGLLLFAVTLLGVTAFFVVPHAPVRESVDHRTGTYGFQAAPGFGYSYSWSASETQGGLPEPDFGPQADFEVAILRAGDTRHVRLLVKNVFGHTSQRDFVVTRELYDGSSGDLPGAVTGGVTIEKGRDQRLRVVGPEPGGDAAADDSGTAQDASGRTAPEGGAK